ncbi:cbb3-type cytochrome oxidase assembly protein CcoS [Alteromonadaceae bacterium BrNp21-10]|nr:cbb3-type cytochrome oxidase assembly protein CcoS [Alteromonadaceae bacterium BrNp21-10]
MEILYILIPVAIVLVCVAIGAFFWAVKSDQFEDLERHGHSILFDDDIKSNKACQPPQKNTTLNKDE